MIHKIKEYDVDVYDDSVNLKIEVTSNPKNFDFNQVLISVKNEILNSLKQDKIDLNVVVEQDKYMSEDEIIFNENMTLTK